MAMSKIGFVGLDELPDKHPCNNVKRVVEFNVLRKFFCRFHYFFDLFCIVLDWTGRLLENLKHLSAL